MDVLFLDFLKTFDKVLCQMLLHKAKAHGVGGSVFGQVEDWRANIKQGFGINGSFSGWQ